MGIRSTKTRRPHDSKPTVGAQIIEGTARMDRRTKNLMPRLHPGNIAFLDHADIDLVAAESLLDHGVAGVVNAASSVSGRYPNIGPLLLVRAGVVLIDEAGPEVFDRLSEGDHVRIEGNRVFVDSICVAQGTRLAEAQVNAKMDAARAILSETVEQFAENTLEYVRREQSLLLDSVRLPDIKTDFKGRYALVVVRGYHYKEDLHALRGFVREMHPVVVAVDGAADACLAEGIKPDVIVGDVDSVSTAALQCGAELLVHPQGDWRRRYVQGDAVEDPPEVELVRALGLDCKIVTAPGMSEDVALLLAHEKGAELVVAVGSHTSAVEFLDKGRAGMASTFLVRMRLGPNLVDAKGVSQLYRTRVQTSDLWLLVAAAVLAMAIVSFVMPPMRLFWVGVGDQIAQIFRSLF